MSTLKEVASAAGVSIRTVTRMLKSEPGGNAATYARVRAVADRMGYVPNIAARNLKIRRSNMVGLVASVSRSDVPVRIRVALQKRLEREGQYLLSGTVASGDAPLSRMLREWSGLARDVVFMAWPQGFTPASVLSGLPMRGIFVDCLPDQTRYDAVTTDRTLGVREGVEWFLKTGHRRIARCGTNMVSRRRGFNAAFTGRVDGAADKCEITTPGLEFEDGYAVGPALMKRAVDAVFFETDRMAFGFYKFAAERGIRIPGDVAVIGFDDEPAGQYVTPALSTVAHPIEAITDWVFNAIMTPDERPRQATFPTRFIPRASS